MRDVRLNPDATTVGPWAVIALPDDITRLFQGEQNDAQGNVLLIMRVFRCASVWAPLALSAIVSASSPALAQGAARGQPPATPVFKVEVIATTPLPGVDLRLEQIPAPVQTAIDRDILESGSLDLADFLNRRVGGVHVNARSWRSWSVPSPWSVPGA